MLDFQANFCTARINGTELARSAQNLRVWLQTSPTDCSDKGWSFCLEGWTKRFGRRTFEIDSLRELACGLCVLCHLSSLNLRVIEDASSDDLNWLRVCTVPTSHLHVHLWDSSAKCRVSVLLVHVDDDCAGQISKVDSVVLDASCLLLKDLQRISLRRTSVHLPHWFGWSHPGSFWSYAASSCGTRTSTLPRHNHGRICAFCIEWDWALLRWGVLFRQCRIVSTKPNAGC